MRHHLAWLTLIALAACGHASGARNGETELRPRDLYPLAEGNVWTYDVDTGIEGAPPALAITRVVSVEGNRYEVSNNNSDPLIYELREEGIWRVAHGLWLLKAPIREGSEWPSTSGMTARITSLSEDVTTPAGEFEGCVRVEETGGTEDRDITTVYCREIGPVLIQSGIRTQLSGMTTRVVARLRGHLFGGEGL